MKKILLIFVLLLLSLSAFAQTIKITKSKSDKIFTYYVKHNSKTLVGDSVIYMLQKDAWFTCLKPMEQKAKIWRIHRYQSIVVKDPKNKRYLHTWVNRIYSTSNYSKPIKN